MGFTQTGLCYIKKKTESNGENYWREKPQRPTVCMNNKNSDTSRNRPCKNIYVSLERVRVGKKDKYGRVQSMNEILSWSLGSRDMRDQNQVGEYRLWI